MEISNYSKLHIAKEKLKRIFTVFTAAALICIGVIYTAPMRVRAAEDINLKDTVYFAGRGILKSENKFTASVWNRYNLKKSVSAIWAEYDKNGSLVKISIGNADTSDTDSENTVYFNSPDGFGTGNADGQIKFFLWENENSPKPVMSALSYPEKRKSKELEILPDTEEYYVNSAEETDDGYVFIYCGNSEIIEYNYRPGKGGFNDITVSVNGEETGVLVSDSFEFTKECTVSERSVRFDGKKAEVNETYAGLNGEQTESIRYSMRISGKTLIMEFSADNGTVTKYRHTVNTEKEIPVPYMPQFVNIGMKNNVFVSLYADWTYGNSSAMSTTGITYNKNTDGIYRPLNERFMFTVSKTVNDVFPSIPNSASEYRNLMADRMVLDWWGHTEKRKPFGYMSEYADYLYDYGLTDVVFIRHIWQNSGYDTKLPESYPANENYGGDAQLVPFGEKMKKFGWIFALHTNYTDYSPYYDEYNQAHAIKNSDGSIRGGGVLGEGEYKILNKFIKSGFYNYYINKHEPEINKRYFTSGSFVDVFAARPHNRDVDYDSSADGFSMHKTVYNDTKSAIETIQKIHNGPLLTEGGWDHARFAGIIDGDEAQIKEASGEKRSGEDVKLMPDFELEKVFPLTLNHGMGYYTRWRTNVKADHLKERLYSDKYRAQQLAYGHSAYAEDRLPAENVSEVLKEYYYMLPIQKSFSKSEVESVKYINSAGSEQSLSEALLSGYYENGEQRLNISYKNGTEIYLNMEEENRIVDGFVIPQYGFYAKGKNFSAGTLKFGGKFADYMICENQVFFDPRTARKTYDSLNIMPYLTNIEIIEFPSSEQDGKIKMEFKWEINEKIPESVNYIVLHSYPQSGGLIASDYRIPVSMMSVTNGEVTASATVNIDRNSFKFGEFYTVTTALRDSLNGVTFKGEGYYYSGGETILGQYRLTENGGEYSLEYKSYSENRANAVGETVNFGGISANEMFTAEKKNDGWYITVLPRHRKLTLTFNNASVIASVCALDADKNKLADVEILDGKTVTLAVPNAYCYRITGNISWN